jgi:hypothetical protein
MHDSIHFPLLRSFTLSHTILINSILTAQVLSWTPGFPFPPGRYLVTGGRMVTTDLTIGPTGTGSGRRRPYTVRCDSLAVPRAARCRYRLSQVAVVHY